MRRSLPTRAIRITLPKSASQSSALGAFAAAVLILSLVSVGCQPSEVDPASYTREQKDAIAAATRAVRQNEDWADRAEYRIQKSGDGWQVTAWRVENPAAKGNARYVPWGFRIIVIDRRGQVAEYKNSK